MHWLHFVSKLHGWKHGRTLFRVCFWLSLLFTFEVIIINSPALSVWLRLNHLNRQVYALLILLELVALFASALFWVGMFVHCTSSRRSIVFKVMWSALFFFGAFWTAEVYYLFIYLHASGVGDTEHVAETSV
jgi:hypothetical protein